METGSYPRPTGPAQSGSSPGQGIVFGAAILLFLGVAAVIFSATSWIGATMGQGTSTADAAASKPLIVTATAPTAAATPTTQVAQSLLAQVALPTAVPTARPTIVPAATPSVAAPASPASVPTFIPIGEQSPPTSVAVTAAAPTAVSGPGFVPTPSLPSMTLLPTAAAPAPVNTVRIGNTGGIGVFIRKAPQTSAQRLGAWMDGTVMQVVGSQDVAGKSWLQVRDPKGIVGWVPAQYTIR